LVPSLARRSTAQESDFSIETTAIDVEGDGDTLRILYDKDQDKGQSKTFQEQTLYEIQLDKEYETIELFENGDIAAFTSVFS